MCSEFLIVIKLPDVNADKCDVRFEASVDLILVSYILRIKFPLFTSIKVKKSLVPVFISNRDPSNDLQVE